MTLEKYSTNPESTCLQSTTLQLGLPRSCQRRLMPTPVCQYEAKNDCGGFCPAKPRCRRSNHVCVPEATGVGYHDGNSNCAFLTKSPRLPLASRRRPRRQDGIMTTAATWRIWSDVGIHWRANVWAGSKRLQSCAAQHVVQQKGRARTGRR